MIPEAVDRVDQPKFRRAWDLTHLTTPKLSIMIRERNRQMHIGCRQCATQLSAELRTVQISERNETMGADLLSAGTVMREDRSYFHGRDGFYIVRPDDLLHVRLPAARWLLWSGQLRWS